jgi:hypothetical protein
VRARGTAAEVPLNFARLLEEVDQQEDDDDEQDHSAADVHVSPPLVGPFIPTQNGDAGFAVTGIARKPPKSFPDG